MEVENIFKLILNLNDKIIEFYDIQETEDWLLKEISCLKWLESIRTSDESKHLNFYIESLILPLYQAHKEINKYKKTKNKHHLNQIKEMIEQASARGFKTSESADGKFISELKNRESNLVAVHALATLSSNLTNNFSIPIETKIKGIYFALEYLSRNKDTLACQKLALEQLKNDIEAQSIAQRNKLKEESCDLLSKISKQLQRLKELKIDMDDSLTKQQDEFSKLKNEANARFQEIENTYNEKLSLHSSINYWSNRGKGYKKWQIIMGMVTFCLSLITCGLFVFFASEIFRTSLQQIPFWEISSLISISTLGIWLTRLSTKIFISNLHLHRDASERVTMINTYLSMLRSNDGLKDNDRHLILQTLFRPSSSGFVKEEGPSFLFNELISRIISK